jgi:hypothetical protein
MRTPSIAIVVAVLGTFAFQAPRAGAALSATAVLSTTSTQAPFDYTITLTNTGTVGIGTLWFGWTNLPGDYNFLPAPASNIAGPGGWFGYSTGPNFAGDGYGVEYYTFSTLPPGQSLPGFTFTSSVGPTHMHDTAASYPAPIDTTVIFQDYTASGTSSFVPVTVATPEPAAITLAAPILLMLRRRK